LESISLSFKSHLIRDSNKIDIGVYIVATSDFQMMSEYFQKLDGSLTFEKVVKYLPHFKSAIQVPIYVIGVEI